MNKLSKEEQVRVVACLVEGNSLRATVRMTGIHRTMIQKLLVELGAACSAYQDKIFRNLNCKRIQCDEIWSFVYANDKNVPENIFLAVTSCPIVTIFLTNFCNIFPIQIRPRFFQRRQHFPLVKFGAWLVFMVIFDFRFEHFDDDFTIDGLTFVDGQPSVILEKIGGLELGNGQNVRLQRATN